MKKVNGSTERLGIPSAESKATSELSADRRFKEIVKRFNAEIVELVGSMDKAPRFQTAIGAGIGIIKLKGGRNTRGAVSSQIEAAKRLKLPANKRDNNDPLIAAP